MGFNDNVGRNIQDGAGVDEFDGFGGQSGGNRCHSVSLLPADLGPGRFTIQGQEPWGREGVEPGLMLQGIKGQNILNFFRVDVFKFKYPHLKPSLQGVIIDLNVIYLNPIQPISGCRQQALAATGLNGRLRGITAV
jgi:hypothetical protein